MEDPLFSQHAWPGSIIYNIHLVIKTMSFIFSGFLIEQPFEIHLSDIEISIYLSWDKYKEGLYNQFYS